MHTNKTQFLKNNYCILGAAKSGLAAAFLLKRLNAKLFITDSNSLSQQTKEYLNQLNIPFKENVHTLKNLYKEFDILIVSPGISPNSEIVQNAKQHNIKIMSEIELALEFTKFNKKLIGITGTNGKSTTTHYCAHLLNSSGLKTYACGNIGIPVSEIAAQKTDYDALCIELSSYQLEYGVPKIFDASIFLNLQNDHLERHKTFENYLRAKWNLILATKDSGVCVIENKVYDLACQLSFPMPKCKIITDIRFFDNPNIQNVQNTKNISQSQLCLNGAHNNTNISAASLVAKHLGISNESILRQAYADTSTYQPLAHRLETVPSTFPQIFINDSKATNVESTLVALAAVNKPIHLLLGGVAKGDSYLPILKFLNTNLVKIYPFGQAGSKIHKELKNHNSSTDESFLAPVSRDMLSAAQNALSQSKPGDVILLSPACSSFDEFKNFEHRGEVFRQWVLSLQENTQDESGRKSFKSNSSNHTTLQS